MPHAISFAFSSPIFLPRQKLLQEVVRGGVWGVRFITTTMHNKTDARHTRCRRCIGNNSRYAMIAISLLLIYELFSHQNELKIRWNGSTQYAIRSIRQDACCLLLLVRPLRISSSYSTRINWKADETERTVDMKFVHSDKK